MEYSILYNQEVTAQMLENIGVDLGAPDFTFTSEKFGADALNGITSALTSAGVLNTLNNCNPTMTDGQITIDTGIIVFAGGAKCKITSPLSFAPEVPEGFVYAEHDVSMNKIFIRCSQTQPTGDFVMLGKISGNTVTPARTFAYGKTAAVTGNVCKTFTLPKTIAVTETETLRLSIPMEGVGYNIMILTRPEDETTQHCNFFAVFDINKGKFIFRSDKDDGFDTAESESLIISMSSPWYKYSVARFAAEDGNINVYTFHNPTSSSYASNDDFGYTINFY